jgi:hypothetical protein
VVSRNNKSPKVTIDDIDAAPNNIPGPVVNFEEKYAELKVKFEELAIREFELRADNAKLKNNHFTSEILNKLIEPYAKKAFSYMVWYSVIVGILLVMCGYKDSGFSLSDQVQSFLVGSTAVTVIGLVGMVLSGIFLGARKN